MTELGKIGDKSVLREVIKWFEEAALGSRMRPTPRTTRRQDHGLHDRRHRLHGRYGHRQADAREESDQHIASHAELKAGDGVEHSSECLTSPTSRRRLFARLAARGFPRRRAISRSPQTNHIPLLENRDSALGDLGDPKAVPTLIDGLFKNCPVSRFTTRRVTLSANRQCCRTTRSKHLSVNTSVEAYPKRNRDCPEPSKVSWVRAARCAQSKPRKMLPSRQLLRLPKLSP